MKRYLIASEQETALFAERVGSTLRGGDTVGLSGALGAGKTTFVRYLVEALGGTAREVSSPTYTLEHEYHVAAERCVDHWDLYRVVGLPEELFEPPTENVIRIVEWPERCPEIAADLDLHITIEFKEGTERIVSFDGARAAALEEIVSLRGA